MHDQIRLFIGLLVFSMRVFGADVEVQKVEDARKLVEEYETAQRARLAVEEITARALISAHESGSKVASDRDLVVAREVMKNADARRADLERARPEPPVLLVARSGSTFNSELILDSANREFVRCRIAEIKGYIGTNDEQLTGRLRQELSAWEKFQSELKPSGKPLRGVQYVTIFEALDCFVVAYFDDSRREHFVCALGKKDYVPRPISDGSKRVAWNYTQKTVMIE